jgi:aspartyl-tRNA(Asn)/glutamyl-tRNA(Gln) amidotransferase subunit A
MMSVLSLPDERDHMSLPYEAANWVELERNPSGLRMGLLLEAGVGLTVEAEIRAAVEMAGKRFEAAGAIVEPMRPFLTKTMMDGLDRFWRMRAFADISGLSKERRVKVLPFIRAWADGAEGLSGMELFLGFSQIMTMRAEVTAACRPYDYVLAPTAPVPAFAAELPCPTNDPSRPFEHIGFTVAFNMSEQPAASINCGYTSNGLPIGLQIIGKRFDDLGVLQMARLFEQLRDAQRPWPDPGKVVHN